MPSYRRFAAGAAATLALAACATVPPKDPAPPVVPGQTLQMWQAEVPGTNAKAIFVRNDGERTIVITEVRLSACVNVRQLCGVYTPNVAILAHQTAMALQIEPQDDGDAFRFNYEYKWRSLSGAR
jgi:hypothetical protein